MSNYAFNHLGRLLNDTTVETVRFRESFESSVKLPNEFLSDKTPDMVGDAGGDTFPSSDLTVGPDVASPNAFSDLCIQGTSCDVNLPFTEIELMSPGLCHLQSDFDLARTDETVADGTFQDSIIRHDDFDWNVYGFDALEDILSRAAPLIALPQDYCVPSLCESPGKLIDTTKYDQTLWRPPPTASSTRTENLSFLVQHITLTLDDPEIISLIFHQYTSATLSIDDGNHPNLWRERIWPLAKEFTALYHAIAAMTCFHLCRLQPEFRIHGVKHVQCTMEELAQNVDTNTIPLDAALKSVVVLVRAGCDMRLCSSNSLNWGSAFRYRSYSRPTPFAVVPKTIALKSVGFWLYSSSIKADNAGNVWLTVGTVMKNCGTRSWVGTSFGSTVDRCV